MRKTPKTSSDRREPSRRVHVLFTSAGRRVELIQAFARAAQGLGLDLRVHVADSDPFVPASFLAAKTYRVPPARSNDYIPALLEISRKAHIDLLIPLIDTELPALSQARERFAEIGCRVVVSSPEVVLTCGDKLAAFDFLRSHGIPTPRTWLPEQALALKRHRFPYFLKPRFGSASRGNFIVRHVKELESLIRMVPEAIVQELVPGIEHTLDVYTGLDGVPRCVVPRRRIEVRGGEVTKALTVRHPAIIDMGVRVATALAGCVGLITIQLFLAEDESIKVIEVNPRFGGGVPLAIHAGADFPRWLLMEWLGRKPHPPGRLQAGPAHAPLPPILPQAAHARPRPVLSGCEPFTAPLSY